MCGVWCVWCVWCVCVCVVCGVWCLVFGVCVVCVCGVWCVVCVVCVWWVCECVSVWVCMCECVCVHVRACVYVYVSILRSTYTILRTGLWPMLWSFAHILVLLAYFSTPLKINWPYSKCLVVDPPKMHIILNTARPKHLQKNNNLRLPFKKIDEKHINFTWPQRLTL